MTTPDTSVRRFPLPSGPILGLFAVFLLFTALIAGKGELGSFLSTGNLRVLIHENTIPAIMALGMLLVMISGGIDLSVGAVVALVTVVTMRLYVAMLPSGTSTASVVAIVGGVLTGGLCGCLNGLIVTKLRLPPFVATLGMLGIARGLGIWIAERRPIAFPANARPEWVESLSRSSLLNPGFWSLVALAIVIALMLHATVFGRHLYAVGSNEATARLCGVRVGRVKILTYTLAGLLMGWAGVVMFAHGDSGNPSAGEGLELIVIASVVIGGASLNGGRGTVVGTIVGVVILGLLANGVSLFNVPVEMQYILMGVIIIANVAIGQWRRNRA